MIISFLIFSVYFQVNINNYNKKTKAYNKTLVGKGYVSVKGVVITTPEIYKKEHGYFIFKLKDKRYEKLINTKIKIYFKPKGKLFFFRGDKIRIFAKFYPINSFNNFYRSLSDKYLLSEKISGSAYIKTIALVEKIGVKNPLYHYLSIYKYDFSMFLDKIKSEENSISIIKAMIIGERKGIPDKIKFLWKESGIYHLLAISGAHIGLLSLLLFYILRFFKIKKKVIYYFQIGFLSVFLLFIGYNPPVFRASLLIILYFIGKLLWKDVDILHLVSFTGIVYLIFFPLSVLGIGFILTYYTTIFLILVFRKFSHLFYVSLKIESSVYLVFFAFIISVPLNIYFFNYTPLGSIIINLFTIFLTPLILFFSFISLITFKLSSVFAIYIIKPAIYIIKILNISTDKIGSHLYIRSVTPPLFLVFLYIAVLLLFILFNKKRIISFSILIGLLLLLILFPERAIKNPSAYFLDVGQGDSAFIETCSAKYLIDCGGSYKKDNFIGEYIVSGFLFKHRVKKIDGIFISHFHPDHYYGCLRVIKNFNVKKVFVYNSDKNIEGFKELKSAIGRRKTKIVFLKHGDKLDFNESKITIIHPDKKIIKRVSNNDSMVMMVDIKGKKLLFTGDLEKEGEKDILEREENIDSDILKVGHHGSNTSSTAGFLKAVSPVYAIISVGRGNRYHLPSKKVLKRIEKAGIITLLTSIRGGIKFSFIKNKIVLDK